MPPTTWTPASWPMAATSFMPASASAVLRLALARLWASLTESMVSHTSAWCSSARWAPFTFGTRTA